MVELLHGKERSHGQVKIECRCDFRFFLQIVCRFLRKNKSTFTWDTRQQFGPMHQHKVYHESESISGCWVRWRFQVHERCIFTIACHFARVLGDRVPSEISFKVLVFSGLWIIFQRIIKNWSKNGNVNKTNGTKGKSIYLPNTSLIDVKLPKMKKLLMSRLRSFSICWARSAGVAIAVITWRVGMFCNNALYLWSMTGASKQTMGETNTKIALNNIRKYRAWTETTNRWCAIAVAGVSNTWT